MSPSKREREYARRRYQKRLARQERARRIARRNRIIAAVVVAVVVVAGAVTLILTQGEEPAPEASSPSAATDPATEPATPGDEDGSDSLPTTDPRTYEAPPPETDALDTDWQATIHTNMGDIDLTLDGVDAPQAVSSFLMLAGDGFFDGTACHRLLPDSLLQCGDPTATGTGGPGYSFGPIENAPSDDVYPAGTLAMARQGDDGESMGSQFFLVFNDVTLPSDSAGGYTVFGQITGGLDILQQIGAAGTADDGSEHPAENVIIESVDIQ